MLPARLEFSGRIFSPVDVGLIIDTVRDFPNLSLTELARTICELLDWKRPTGKLKQEECRALLARLQDDGLIHLPKLWPTAAPGPRKIKTTNVSDPQAPVTGGAGDFEPLSLHLVQASNQSLCIIFKQLIDRYHYLGYRIPFGAHLRYLVDSQKLPGRWLACLLFSSPAWKMAPRDAWIGWSNLERKRGLQFVVCHSRFLVLPWVDVKGLASKILSLAAHRLPQDWHNLYGYRPLLLETLVDRSRYRGTCYRAANWIYLGCTQGRGRMDRHHAAHGQAVKDIYVYPLSRHAQAKLRSAVLPVFIDDDETVMPLPVR